jgi:hypothetical protein
MIYTTQNTYNASVFDVETQIKVEFVSAIDTESGALTVIRQPIEVVDDEIVCDTVQYRAVHPVFGGNVLPQMFLCFR